MVIGICVYVWGYCEFRYCYVRNKYIVHLFLFLTRWKIDHKLLGWPSLCHPYCTWPCQNRRTIFNSWYLIRRSLGVSKLVRISVSRVVRHHSGLQRGDTSTGHARWERRLPCQALRQQVRNHRCRRRLKRQDHSGGIGNYLLLTGVILHFTPFKLWLNCQFTKASTF